MYKKLIYLTYFVCVLSLASNTSAELVAYWKFDEGYGTVAYDSGGNGLHGTLEGDPRWVAGKIGGALEFDGAGDYVDCGNSELFNMVDELTVSAWVNIRSVTAAWMTVIAKGDSAWRISVNNTTQGMHFGFEDGTRGWQAANSTAKLPLNEWHHVCGTYDLKNGGRIYIDGVLEGTNPDNLGITHSTYNVYIGENAQAVNRWWDGFIDDVQIYNHTLTEAEILAAMQGAVEYPYAFGADPPDGSMIADTWVNLSWLPGDTAISHDVYFGDDFDDVDTGTGDTFRGNQTETFFDVGVVGSPCPEGLVPGTTYYWRIDEVEADGTTINKGTVWKFTITRGGGGLQGKYYQWSGQAPPSQSAAFSRLVMTRTDPQINFNWGNRSPGPSIYADNFSVRWTGEVQAAFTETYTFYTTTDDGVRLWVNGQKIIDKWIEQSTTEWNGKIDLVAGQKYNIVMEYYENFVDAVAQLRWSSLHTPKQLVPEAALSPTAGVDAGVGVIELTDAAFNQIVLSSDVPVLVDFWAPWCGPCLTMAPVIEEIADEYAGRIKVCKLNVDNELQTTTNYGIRYIPTFILFKDGRVQRQWVGVTSKNELTAAIDELLHPSPPTNIIELTDATFNQIVLSSDLPVLVDFWAPWCGPCLTMAPVIEQIADEYAGRIKVCKLNVDNAPQTTTNYDIRYIPTFILFKDGRVQRQWVGVTSKNDLTAAIQQLAESLSPESLSEALDTTLTFTTGGSADWFAQTTTSRYGGDAAQSGDISHRQDSWMQTTVSGIGTIKFYWMVSSEEGFDFLEFYIDGSLQEEISGLDNYWEQQTYTISTSGSHTLEWRYVKDGSGDEGSDRGWVDKVEWLTTP